ncbi:MAG: AmmeMemoRadiSam system protein B [Elusimicrobia bacterium]|nr:AmmeMemoRadiSam system protein B [Elusimicrobiota bacterium]
MSRLPASVPRPPAVAGQFYPGEPRAIAKAVARLLEAAPRREPGDVVALISPHAGLDYSGGVAAAAYRALPAGAFDSVVIVGAGHRKAVAGAAIYPGDYGTPEGMLPFDRELAEGLLEASPLIAADASAHGGEHSVEIQVPFIRQTLGPVKAVGLVMNTDELANVVRVGMALAEAVRGRKTLLVASTDLSHFPSGAMADLVDATTVEALATMEPATFWLSNELLLDRGLPGLATTCCGAAGAAAVLIAAKELGATELQVLERVHSGTVAGEKDARRVVGYAAAAFVRSKKPRGPRTHTGEEQAELLDAARQSIRCYLAEGKAQTAPLSRFPRLNLPGSAFVTLTEANGDLRGCIGDLEPRQSLFESVCRNAVAAAVRDRRFPAVTAGELGGIRIEVSVLSPQRTAHWKEVKPGDGVRIERGGRAGVFLPQVWEKLAHVEEFLSTLCAHKAGLPPDAYRQPGTVLKIFAVEKIEE